MSEWEYTFIPVPLVSFNTLYNVSKSSPETKMHLPSTGSEAISAMYGSPKTLNFLIFYQINFFNKSQKSKLKFLC